jgi:hypothetical protein
MMIFELAQSLPPHFAPFCVSFSFPKKNSFAHSVNFSNFAPSRNKAESE